MSHTLTRRLNALGLIGIGAILAAAFALQLIRAMTPPRGRRRLQPGDRR